jgi:hypothetical protein
MCKIEEFGLRKKGGLRDITDGSVKKSARKQTIGVGDGVRKKRSEYDDDDDSQSSSEPSYKKKVDKENHEDRSVNASPTPVTIAAKTKVIKTLDSFKDHMLTHKQKLSKMVIERHKNSEELLKRANDLIDSYFG